MKKSLLMLLLSAALLSASAQAKRRSTSSAANPSGFSIGLEAGIPFGENGNYYSSVLGGSLQYETMPSSDIGVTFGGGYLNYAFKSSYGGGSVGFVPLLAGVKFYFAPKVFFHAQAGAAVGTKTGQGTSFAYSPGIGFKLSPKVDAELKYMGISNKGGTISNAGVRIAYNF